MSYHWRRWRPPQKESSNTGTHVELATQPLGPRSTLRNQAYLKPAGPQPTLNWMTTREKLETLYKQLNAPSAKAFHRALALQGIPARLKDIREFVESKSERQILAPPPKYTGRVVATDIDDLWMADLIAFTSRPVKRRNFERLRTAEKSYTHVLVVIDVFSRQLWTKPLQSTSQTTEAFKAILQNGRKPRELDTNGGTEWQPPSSEHSAPATKLST